MLNVQFIKKTMRGLGLTGEDVWDVCGVTKEAGSNWLKGESHSMRRTNAVGADPILSHRADRILSQGWKPTLRLSAVDKSMPLGVGLPSMMVV